VFNLLTVEQRKVSDKNHNIILRTDKDTYKLYNVNVSDKQGKPEFKYWISMDYNEIYKSEKLISVLRPILFIGILVTGI